MPSLDATNLADLTVCSSSNVAIRQRRRLIESRPWTLIKVASVRVERIRAAGFISPVKTFSGRAAVTVLNGL